eukprot:gb/GECG01004213.1/.p1 GENE.gb/GECG01004213.1/~~gb/GECG01004213.1/.p1  ORF type:complete len:687 (+),score=64.75 gb/GECG01004213.1/:1-2061(+)
MSCEEALRFQALETLINTEFWVELRQKKLNEWKLDNTAKTITGMLLLPCGSRTVGHFTLRKDSFTTPIEIARYSMEEIPLQGEIIPVNTLNEFRRLDKKELVNRKCEELLKAMVDSDDILAHPEKLCGGFLCLTFADLANHTFVYWFCFPTLVPDKGFCFESSQNVDDVLSVEEVEATEHFLRSQRDSRTFNPLAFVIERESNGSRWEPHHLTDLRNRQVEEVRMQAENDNIIFATMDTGEATSGDMAGTLCRNVLAFIVIRYRIRRIRLLLCRLDRRGNVIRYSDTNNSFFTSVSCEANCEIPNEVSIPEGWNASGWQLNKRGNPGPRTTDLRSVMDPQKLAYESVFLNLSLMKWRAMPSLDIEGHKEQRCLLLGAGTLGCNVARVLLGWGFQKITFVDSGSVSYSNPVRQPLFEFSDAFKDGPARRKVDAAADTMSRIFPGVEANGVHLSIPMPGHTDSSTETDTRDSCQQLLNLISGHDIVFLLTDTRESRWLPTLICSSLKKPLLNVALGFDTFLVMRHGVRSPEETNSHLGCYFCSDVVAPVNSVRDQTLDQQCTVTRPGLAPIAASMAVELLVNCLHHPDGFHALAEDSQELLETPQQHLGIVPHQLRGYLSHFSTIPLFSQAFDKCTACSRAVTGAFEQDQLDFVVKALQEPETVLEDISGLSQLKKELDESNFIWDSE